MSPTPGDLRSLRDVVKRLPNWLKIGFQARFGPNFTVDLEAEIPKKFGLAYCPGSAHKCLYSNEIRVNLAGEMTVGA